MSEPIVNRRRIDHLKAHAYSLGLTNDEAKKIWQAFQNFHLGSCLRGLLR